MRVEARRAEPRRHPLREEPVVVGPRDEVPPDAPHRPEPGRDGGEELLQVATASQPELVRIRIEHPVGTEGGGGEARHARDPLALPEVVAGLADQVEHAVARVPLEDLRRRVLRPVVGRDDEVDARLQVVRDLRIDDVGLVAREEGHDELHAAVEVSGAPGTPRGVQGSPALPAW